MSIHTTRLATNGILICVDKKVNVQGWLHYSGICWTMEIEHIDQILTEIEFNRLSRELAMLHHVAVIVYKDEYDIYIPSNLPDKRKIRHGWVIPIKY